MKPDSDLSVVHRAGRIAAAQASLALAAVLLVVGAVVYFVDIRVQEQQIRSELSSVALAADDANDPPPGMILVLRDLAGKVEVSADGIPTAELLARPAGFSEAQIDGVPYRAVVMDKPEGRVVALLDLGPIPAGTPVSLISNLDLENKGGEVKSVLKRLQGHLGDLILTKINPDRITDEEMRKVYADMVDPMLKVSKCPDFVVNRGHYFGTDYLPADEGRPGLGEGDKRALIEFLKTM